MPIAVPLALRPSRRAPHPPADPALAAYLNEQLAAATGLGEQLRRAAGLEGLLAERTTLLRVRREVAADRAALRSAMRRLGAPTDWAVVGVSWLSACAGRLTPLLHRLPVVERLPLPAAHPSREAGVEALLVLEDVLGGLHRRAVAARLLSRLVADEPAEWARALRALAERTRVQLAEVEAAHERCAAALLRR
ncbi:hypothetical protein [Kineococcus sp. SYSU DK006]|uniref:hypothetical protein n=1 Tax=Kineococcus sp. SYSU DK006 TaxID=3383127 RepID=UPI003D7E6E85